MNINYNVSRVMKIKHLCFTMILVFMSAMSIQSTYASEQDSIPEATYEYGYPAPLALGVHAGTAGFGLHLYKPLGKKFGARLGFSHMPFGTQIVGTYANRSVRSDVSAQSTNISLLFGWTPFVNYGGFFRSFQIQLGGAYFTQLKGTLTSRLRDPYALGDITLKPELVGTITTHVNWKKTVNPYAGIGWTNIIIDNRFSMNIDLGMYYLSKPKVSMEATGLLEENVNNAARIEKNIENYRYLPRFEIGFSYRFN